MATPDLAELPPELQIRIVSFVRKLGHLRNIALVSRAFHAAALPTLYREVTIQLNARGNRSSVSNSFLTAESAGHKYVRKLSFEGWISQSRAADALRIIKATLQVLPKDCLQCFSLDESLRPDRDVLELLCSYQKQLKGLHLGSPDTHTLLSVLKAPCCSPQWLSTLTDLTVYRTLGTSPELEPYHHILQRTDRLATLTIDADYDWIFNQNGINNTSDLLVTTLFRHIQPAGAQPPMRLSCLKLANVDFRWAKTSLNEVIDVHGLKELSIERCAGDTCFLRCLTVAFESTGLCALQEVNLVMQESPGEVLHDFVKSCSPLRTLTLACMVSDRHPSHFDTNCLIKHLPTLEQLSIEVVDDNRREFERTTIAQPAETLEVLEHCPKLAELVVGMSQVVLPASNSAAAASFKGSLEMLSKIPSLRVLHLLMRPEVPEHDLPQPPHGGGHDEQSFRASRARYLEILDSFAEECTAIMRAVRCDRALPGEGPQILGFSNHDRKKPYMPPGRFYYANGPTRRVEEQEARDIVGDALNLY